MKVTYMTKKVKDHLTKVKNNIQSTSNRFLSSIMLESVIAFLSSIQGIVLTSFLLFINFSEEQIAILILQFIRSITLVCIHS